MEENNSTINLGNNLSDSDIIIPGVSSIEKTIVSNNNQPIDVTNLASYNTTITNFNVSNPSDVIQVNQQKANMEAAAQVVTPSLTTGQSDLSLSSNTFVDMQTTVEKITSEHMSVPEDIQDNNVSSDENKPKGDSIIAENVFTMNDDFIVNTELFKAMVSDVRKAAIGNSYVIKTSILDITFDNECLKVVAFDGDNVLMQVNKNIGYKNTLHFNVSADFLGELVSKQTCETLKFTHDPETRYIIVEGNNGSSFKLPEYYDRESGQTINLERPESLIQSGDIEIDIDGLKLKQDIQDASVLCSTEKMYEYISGVYCSDRIYSTNIDNVFGLINLSELAGYSMYLPAKFIKLFLSVTFSSKSKLVLRPSTEDRGVISHIIIMDDNMLLEGSCSQEFASQYPIEDLKPYFNRKLDTKFTIEKSKLIEVLKIAEIFVESATDNECCVFIPNFEKGYLEVKSLNNQAHQYIPITGLDKEVRTFYLKVKDFIKVLDICKNDFITIEVDTEDYKCIRINEDSVSLVVSIQNIQR